jgi:cAMP-specific phosphodiesterase 4
VHDYGHKGLTNDYLVVTQDHLALRYNDRSPHEHYHVSEAFRLLLLQPGCNFLDHLPLVSLASSTALI